MQTMLSYYQSIKSDVDTAIKGEIHPVGALALVCAAVSTFCILFLHFRLSNLQVGRALRMHQTGVFVVDRTPFSETAWGRETAIYTKLINDMASNRWDGVYTELQLFETINGELKEHSESKPECRGERGPQSYRIQDSDPMEPGEDAE